MQANRSPSLTWYSSRISLTNCAGACPQEANELQSIADLSVNRCSRLVLMHQVHDGDIFIWPRRYA